MKKIISLFLIALFCFTGCASVQKKFTRKKPEKRIPAVVYFQEGPYQKKYSNEYYYKSHYTYWKSWHGDLIDSFGGNHKKVKRSAEEALNHLVQMSQYLKPEKQQELNSSLDSLKKIVERIEQNNYSPTEVDGVRSGLEKLRRIISSNFYYEKVKEGILSDAVDLGPAPVEPAPVS